jgi:hypothetical protein
MCFTNSAGRFDATCPLVAFRDRCSDANRAEGGPEHEGGGRATWSVSHDNDPIAVLGPDLLVQRPPWLADGQRGRGVPHTMRWQPLGTFIQTGMDAMNAMLLTPGQFASFGHDYRADMAAFVRDAYGLPEATDEQLEQIEQVLRSLEFERHERIKAEGAHTAPPAPAHRTDLAGGVPLRSRRSAGPPWLRRPTGRERGQR